MEPKRRIQIRLELGADSWEHAAEALRSIALEIDQGYCRGESVSGGYTSGYVCSATEDPSVSHESFTKALMEYVGRRQ